MPKFNPPPNWPAPPPGWTPPQGWKAPANWPPPPKGWKFWLPDEKDGSWFGRHKTLTSVGVLAALLLLFIVSVASGGDDPSPNAAATPTNHDRVDLTPDTLQKIELHGALGRGVGQVRHIRDRVVVPDIHRVAGMGS